MKLLLATMKMGIGGAETHIYELALELKSRGHDVTVVSGGGVYADRLSEQGIKTVSLPLDRKTPISLLRSYTGLERLIKRESFDIVHAHARIPALLCGRLQYKYGFRFVTSVHYDFKLTPLLKKISDWGEYAFAVSRDLKKYICDSYGYPSERVAVVPNGVDTESFKKLCDDGTLKKELCINGKTVLHISRLEDYSCLCAEALINSMRAVLSVFPDTTLIIVGGGGAFKRLSDEAGKINSEFKRNAVIMTGARTDVLRFITASDIFVGPSRAAMEAMACEKPTVISGSQGHIGIFSEKTRADADRTNLCGRGLLLPTSEILSECIIELLSKDGKELSEIGKQCREYIKENYSRSRMTDIYENGYKELLKINTKAPADTLICGYYGFGNIGDEALAESIIKELRKRNPELSVCLMTQSPKRSQRRYSVRTVHRMNIFAVKAVMKRAKTFIFGGGNLLQDKTSTHSLIYYTHMLSLAAKCGLRVVVLSNGIGPISEGKNTERVHDALLKADSISLRDESSYAFAKKLLGDGARLKLTFDPAVLFGKSADIPEIPSVIGNQKYFVVFPKHISAEADGTLCRAVSLISKELSLIPVVIPMYAKEDMALCVQMTDKIKGALLISYNNSCEITDILSNAEFSLCSRLHSLVFSTTAQCPMMAFSDDEKLFSYISCTGEETEAGGICAFRHYAGENELLLCARMLIMNSEKIRKSLCRKLPGWRMLAEKAFDFE